MNYATLKYLLLLFPATVFSMVLNAQQEPVTLEQFYQMAEKNYPAIKKLDLIAKSGEYEIENANKRFLPQVTLSGQATYQSETINFSDAVGSLPGISLPSLGKDQYRVQGEISQLLYDGGNIRFQRELIRTGSSLQEQSTKAALYSIKQRINNIYFSVLLMDAQLKQNQLNKENLQTQITKTEAAVKNGIAFRSNLDELKAEMLNIEMIATEYRANRTAFLKMLSLFIGKELPASIQLEIPQMLTVSPEINRPELKVYDLQKSIYDVQRKQLKSEYLPQVSVFFQGAYGRPTLNIIKNEFGAWYVAGMRFSWSLGSLYSLSNRKSLLDINQKSVNAEKETFLLNTKIDMTQQDEQVKKYRQLIKQDEEAVVLRSMIVKAAEAQLHNGVITTHEYIQKLNAVHLATEMKIKHEVQLRQAEYNQKFISGN